MLRHPAGLWKWLKGRPQGVPDPEPSPSFPISRWHVYGVDLLRYVVSLVAFATPIGFAMYVTENPSSPGAVSVYVPSWIGLLIMQWELNVLRLPEATRTVTKAFYDVSRVRVVYALMVSATAVVIPLAIAVAERLGSHAAWVNGDLIKGLAVFIGFAGVAALRAANAADRERAIAFAVSEDERVRNLPEWRSGWRCTRPAYPRIWLVASLVTSIAFVALVTSARSTPEPEQSGGGSVGAGWTDVVLLGGLAVVYVYVAAPSLLVRLERGLHDAEARRKAQVCAERHSCKCPGHPTHMAKGGTYEI